MPRPGVSPPHTGAPPRRPLALRLPRGAQRPGRLPSQCPLACPSPRCPHPGAPCPPAGPDPPCLSLGSKAPSHTPASPLSPGGPALRSLHPWDRVWGPPASPCVCGTLLSPVRGLRPLQLLSIAGWGRLPCSNGEVQRKPPSGSGRRGTPGGRLRRGVDARRPLPPRRPPAPPGTDLEQNQVPEGQGPDQAQLRGWTRSQRARAGGREER